MIFISKYVEDLFFFLLSYHCKLSKLQKYWVEKLSQLWWTWHSKNSIDFDLDLDSYRRTCGFKRGVLWWFWRFVWVRLCGHFPCAHPFPIFIHSHNTDCVGSECHQTYKSEGGINILNHAIWKNKIHEVRLYPGKYLSPFYFHPVCHCFQLENVSNYLSKNITSLGKFKMGQNGLQMKKAAKNTGWK